MKHVILGAGPAGIIAAETIRKHAPHDEILVIGDEPEAPYSRMAIPYLLIGKVGEEGALLRHGLDHYAKLGITLRRARAKLDVLRQLRRRWDAEHRGRRLTNDRQPPGWRPLPHSPLMPAVRITCVQRSISLATNSV